uniref:Fe2OG dioxygenase domain-containing protein n=1 Tax=Haemonchus placei TaxID=6290 RepID=A0A0N4WKN6_HAEPC
LQERSVGGYLQLSFHQPTVGGIQVVHENSAQSHGAHLERIPVSRAERNQEKLLVHGHPRIHSVTKKSQEYRLSLALLFVEVLQEKAEDSNRRGGATRRYDISEVSYGCVTVCDAEPRLGRMGIYHRWQKRQ